MLPPAATRNVSAGQNERPSPAPRVDFDTLFREYLQLVARIVRRVVGDGPEVDDVVQKVFLSVFLHRKELEHLQNPRAWLARVALNAARDFLKSRKRRREVPTDESALADSVGYDAENERSLLSENVEDSALVGDAVEALSPGDRDLLFKVLASGAAEVARASNSTSAAVRGKYARIVERVREMVRRNRRKS